MGLRGFIGFRGFVGGWGLGLKVYGLMGMGFRIQGSVFRVCCGCNVDLKQRYSPP